MRIKHDVVVGIGGACIIRGDTGIHLSAPAVHYRTSGILLGYRSGHNEAVLKTVCCNRHVGSNPTPTAIFHIHLRDYTFRGTRRIRTLG